MARHQSYYRILGLDAPPEDRKTVKRAYSKLLKVTRPEDDPEGFMRLRDAHDKALNILARNAETAAWQAQQSVTGTPIVQEPTPATEFDPSETDSAKPDPADDTKVSSEPSLTYEEMIPHTQEQTELVQDTSYSIGPTPSLDAPVWHPEPEIPKAPPLVDLLEELLSDSRNYNDREKWNQLFREARQLDIDDYVDFEHLLLEHILNFHGYFDYDNPLHETPEKLHQKLSPSIAASLFKTMSWDQINTRGYHRGQQIEWLERRMQLRKRGASGVPVPQTDSGGNGSVWMWIIGGFILLKFIQALANI